MIENTQEEVSQRVVSIESEESANTVFSIEPMSAQPLDVQQVLAQANTLRSEAATDWQQFHVAGRNATKKTMQKVYALFYVVMHSDEKDRIVGRMKVKLPEKKVRANTKEAAIFIRYVFEDFDDKQVHVYSTSLEVGFSKLIEPNGFITWVEAHKGGFDGIRAEAAMVEGGALKTELWEMGMGWASGAIAVETIKADDWDEDEPCRVLIAVPNGDGTAGVKDTEMTLEQVREVLAIYSKAVKERNKPKGKTRVALTPGEKKAKTQLKNDLNYQKQMVDEYRFDLSQATKQNNLIDKEKAESNLCLAQVKMVGIKAALKALGAQGEAA